MKTLLLLFILTLSTNLYCQQFQLTDINSTQFSIDRIAQQVYFKDFYTDTVRKVDLRDMSLIKLWRHISLPIFANKHHIMLYGNSTFYNDSGDSSKDNIYLYNLDKNSYFLISDTLGYLPYPNEYPYSFSPNDSNFIFTPSSYLSLKDSSLKPFNYRNIEYSINDAWPQWSSDTSFVFIAPDDSVIAEYFLKSGKVDTLVTAHGFKSGFSYNTKYEILAYAVGSAPSHIYFHYVNKNIPDSLIFETEDSHDLTGLQALRWSPDNTKLAFICSIIDLGSQIYVYDLDSNKTYSVGGDGVTHYIRWANNDTLIFASTSELKLFGLNVSSITSVKMTQTNNIPNKFIISNYPNPFNHSTRLDIKIPKKEYFKIKIYDALGNLVKTINVNPSSTEINNIIWNGINNSGKEVSSGVYFAIAIINDEIHSNTIKLILLK